MRSFKGLLWYGMHRMRDFLLALKNGHVHNVLLRALIGLLWCDLHKLHLNVKHGVDF